MLYKCLVVHCFLKVNKNEKQVWKLRIRTGWILKLNQNLRCCKKNNLSDNKCYKYWQDHSVAFGVLYQAAPKSRGCKAIWQNEFRFYSLWLSWTLWPEPPILKNTNWGLPSLHRAHILWCIQPNAGQIWEDGTFFCQLQLGQVASHHYTFIKKCPLHLFKMIGINTRSAKDLGGLRSPKSH